MLPFLRGEGLTTIGDFAVSAGQRVPFVLTYVPSHLPLPERVNADDALQSTEEFWRSWASKPPTITLAPSPTPIVALPVTPHKARRSVRVVLGNRRGERSDRGEREKPSAVAERHLRKSSEQAGQVFAELLEAIQTVRRGFCAPAFPTVFPPRFGFEARHERASHVRQDNGRGARQEREEARRVNPRSWPMSHSSLRA
jgi:hypothetical protein